MLSSARHLQYCEKYGISRQQLQAVPESTTNIAYTRYVLDTSMQGDLLDARVVTAPCLIGYGHVGARLLAATEGVETDETKNPYWGWIKEYGSDWYQGAVRKGIRESRSIALLSTRPGLEISGTCSC